MGQSMPDSGYVRLFAMPIVIQLQIVHYYLPCCAAMQGKGERERERMGESMRLPRCFHMSRTEATPPHSIVLARTNETEMVIRPVHADVVSIATSFEDYKRLA
jgi:hypothetical protein